MFYCIYRIERYQNIIFEKKKKDILPINKLKICELGFNIEPSHRFWWF